MERPIETAAGVKALKYARAVELLILYFGDDTMLAASLRQHLPNVQDNEALAKYLVTQMIDNFEQKNITFNPEKIQDYVRAIHTSPIFISTSNAQHPDAQSEHSHVILQILQGEFVHDETNSTNERLDQYFKLFEDIIFGFNSPFFKKSDKSNHTNFKNPHLNTENNSTGLSNSDNQSLLKLALQSNLNQSETISRQQLLIDQLQREKQQLEQQVQQLKAEAAKQEIQRLKIVLANLQRNPPPPLAAEPPRPKSPPAVWPLSGGTRDIRDMGLPTDTTPPVVPNRSPSDRDSAGTPPQTYYLKM